ncbi:DUF6054 family protein [Sporosarcina limicola]|uniref:Uncharacterized protein n=1 Tax=Sporosarcina limicola TaxID=34101 RepID=A0A927RF24_9BACL|nr:DUF6054 family protein [Sporosarcina limicola]MBE1555122.1 hypothetical protein [Sporosarcina limicola]
MSILEFRVKVTPAVAKDIITRSIVGGSVTGKVVDTYVRKLDDKEIIVLIMEKFYMRASRVTLTVTIDNVEDVTKVHVVGSGGSEGVLPIDWGAGRNFAGVVEKALGSYMIGRE